MLLLLFCKAGGYWSAEASLGLYTMLKLNIVITMSTQFECEGICQVILLKAMTTTVTWNVGKVQAQPMLILHTETNLVMSRGNVCGHNATRMSMAMLSNHRTIKTKMRGSESLY